MNIASSNSHISLWKLLKHSYSSSLKHYFLVTLVLVIELFLSYFIYNSSAYSKTLLLLSILANTLGIQHFSMDKDLPSVISFKHLLLISLNLHENSAEKLSTIISLFQFIGLIVIADDLIRCRLEFESQDKKLTQSLELVNIFFDDTDSHCAVLDQKFNFIRKSRCFDILFREVDFSLIEYVPKLSPELKRNVKNDINGLFDSVKGTGKLETVNIHGIRYLYEARTISYNNQPAVLLRLKNANSEALLEKEVQEGKMKSELLRTVTHELRTPVNSIMNMISLASNDSIPNGNTEKLNIAYSSCQYLLCIINDLLDYSQIKAGCLRITKSSFLLKAFIKDVIDLVRCQAGVKSLTIINKSHDSVPETVYSDPFRLKQILLNLLSNSIKFTSSGYIELSITRCGKTLKFSCKDTGIGIKPDKLNTLFSMFAFDDDTKDLNPQGVGLGLYISNILAIQLGSSSIQVESILGKGSEFSFAIDYLNNELHNSYIEDIPEEVCDIHLPDSSPPQNLSNKTKFVRKKTLRSSTQIINTNVVLIADDSSFNIMVFNQLLQKEGILTNAVYNGDEAVKEIIKHDGRYECILLDCEMPVMNGWEVARKLKEYKRLGMIKNLPIIIGTTAYCDESIMASCTNAGMDDVIIKPCVREELILKIHYWVKMYRMNLL
ncbi:hypothetical protein SteCoe_18800 [Stentor coeruleus]|uniref:Histidine kinase n=1 Tax=Stentor coeruleus TaxID=5963 RepID=A0A1R2BVQ4_9CILI|nr:hypothetical protein SteCoe_18800 [Stentor coeruleus]